jgi:aldehyde:ferredoxin oxidoreductase
MREEVKSGPYAGFKADREGYERMLEEFYSLWGWDPKSGLPTRSCLQELGLDEIADCLARYARLAER